MAFKPLAASLLLLALTLAGCSGDEDKGGGDAMPSATPTSTGPAPNRPPVGSAGVALNGTSATFTLNGTDPDGDALNWTLAFGDGNSTNGTSLPANATHDYGASGVFNATFTLGDGNLTSVYNLTVNATTLPGGPTQGPVQLTGEVMCVPTVVVEGQIQGGENEFVVEPGQTRLVLVLSYDDPSGDGVVDLDFAVTDAAGEETVSEEAGPEPPLEFENPVAGTWTISVIGYSCIGSASYTIDGTFG